MILPRYLKWAGSRGLPRTQPRMGGVSLVVAPIPAVRAYPGARGIDPPDPAYVIVRLPGHRFGIVPYPARSPVLQSLDSLEEAEAVLEALNAE